MNRPAQVLWLLALGFAVAAGCAALNGFQVTPAGRAADWRRFERVAVVDFKAADTPDGGGAEAALKFNDRVADALHTTGAFRFVERPGGNLPGTVRVEATVLRAVAGSDAARELGDEAAGTAAFEAVVGFYDATSDGLLATLRVDRRTWNVEREDPAPETLEAFIAEAARKVAWALAEARTTGRFPD
jgi:hypothetical protein